MDEDLQQTAQFAAQWPRTNGQNSCWICVILLMGFRLQVGLAGVVLIIRWEGTPCTTKGMHLRTNIQLISGHFVRRLAQTFAFWEFIFIDNPRFSIHIPIILHDTTIFVGLVISFHDTILAFFKTSAVFSSPSQVFQLPASSSGILCSISCWLPGRWGNCAPAIAAYQPKHG
jgi:hypothetical protein